MAVTAIRAKRGDGARGPTCRTYPHINLARTAAAFGMHPSHLSRLLSGKNRPTLASAEKLAAILNIPIGEVGKLYKPQPQPQPKLKPNRTKGK
jgi:transcriptional regulator with XRE-family HTH domain